MFGMRSDLETQDDAVQTKAHECEHGGGAELANLLIIEDEVPIRRLVKAAMASEPFRLVETGSAQEGIEVAAKRRPDIILLDLGLPDGEGLQVIRAVREWSQVPIIIVSGRDQESLKVEAFELGADDYVTKPFGTSELLARMRAVMRRYAREISGTGSEVLEFEGLKIDLLARRVTVRGRDVHLTPLEYKLLCAMARHAGKVVPHRQLLVEVWGAEYSDEAQYLRVYMGYLRKKIEENPSQPKWILNEPRIGYRLNVSD